MPQELANDTSQDPVAGSTRRGRQPGEVVKEPEEEEPPVPIEHTDPGKLNVYETYGWFAKEG